MNKYRYQTSRDYSLLWELAATSSVICIVDYNWCDGAISRDIASTQCYGERTRQISCRGVYYVGPDDEKERFIWHCEKYNVEFIVPGGRE